MQFSDDETKMSVSIVAKSIESGELSSSSSKWNLGLDELFVACLYYDDKSKNKKNQSKITRIFLLISLNQISIRSCLISHEFI